eukprot:gnl/TRDRNA2_/TRDRNA2_121257_c0_seq2.p1 gnl/TRDRNA2_/TRDRNA2_121257_c0~~gnl/TRDRNA2_/TRDRNA2_121257_c0_seq2.p1  ORF type:complete len:179 (+),score=45.56 gnl/TRDRNA2_/TRDRNA2_121257_c0_seq2:69-605(+)
MLVRVIAVVALLASPACGARKDMVEKVLLTTDEGAHNADKTKEKDGAEVLKEQQTVSQHEQASTAEQQGLEQKKKQAAAEQHGQEQELKDKLHKESYAPIIEVHPLLKAAASLVKESATQRTNSTLFENVANRLFLTRGCCQKDSDCFWKFMWKQECCASDQPPPYGSCFKECYRGCR